MYMLIYTYICTAFYHNYNKIFSKKQKMTGYIC